MALFFDARWFDARLSALGLSRDDLGRVLGLDEVELRALWKDQRGLSPRELTVMSALLDVPVAELAAHAGVRLPSIGIDLSGRVSALEARVRELEAALLRLSERQ